MSGQKGGPCREPRLSRRPGRLGTLPCRPGSEQVGPLQKRLLEEILTILPRLGPVPVELELKILRWSLTRRDRSIPGRPGAWPGQVPRLLVLEALAHPARSFGEICRVLGRRNSQS